jgi:hypothetical protein
VVEEVQAARDLHIEEIRYFLDDNLMRDAPDDCPGFRALENIVNVRFDAATKRRAIFFDCDRAQGVGGDAEIVQMLLCKELRDSAIAADIDEPLEPGGHAVGRFDCSSKRRHEQRVGMTVLANQAASFLSGLLSSTRIQLTIVAVDILAAIVAVAQVDQHADSVDVSGEPGKISTSTSDEGFGRRFVDRVTVFLAARCPSVRAPDGALRRALS